MSLDALSQDWHTTDHAATKTVSYVDVIRLRRVVSSCAAWCSTRGR